jgi:hypothetical protein
MRECSYCHVLGVCGYRRAVDWILDLVTRLGNTSNYSDIADHHTLQITAANTKSSSARSVFDSRFLVTDVNSANS